MSNDSSRDAAWADLPCWSGVSKTMQARLTSGFPGGPDELARLVTDNGKNHDAVVFEVPASGGGIDVSTGTVLWFVAKPSALALKTISTPKSSQGAGRGIRVLWGTYAVAKRLGCRRLTMQAADVGSYAWARAGFKPTATGWRRLASTIRHRIGRGHHRLDAPDHDAVAKLLAADDAAAIWQLADYRGTTGAVGRDLLLGETWHGSLELDDAAAVRRLTEYARSKGASV